MTWKGYKVILVAAVFPGREYAIQTVVKHILNQKEFVDKILISGCSAYTRSKFLLRNISFSDPLVHYRTDCPDQGPGTKLLCAIETLNIMKMDPSKTILVVFDDDRIYKNWTLHEILACVKLNVACSHFTMTAKELASRSGISNLEPFPNEIILGQGADMFAMNLKMAYKLKYYFGCMGNKSQDYLLNDDLLISTYLKFVEKQKIRRASFRKPYTPIRDSKVTSVGLVYEKNHMSILKKTFQAFQNKEYKMCAISLIK